MRSIYEIIDICTVAVNKMLPTSLHFFVSVKKILIKF